MSAQVRLPRRYPYSTCLVIAGDLLQRAGFHHRFTSSKSEAQYYGWPGRFGTLRVAAHKKGGPNKGLVDGPTVASATFVKENRQGFVAAQIEHEVARAIGLYMIRARPVGEVR